MLDIRASATLAIVAVAFAFRLLFGVVVNRKLGGLTGHQNLTNFISGIFAIGLMLLVLHIWDLISTLLSILAALGVIGAALVFTLKDIWISNVFAGISLIGDRLINVGSEVEIGGKRGKVIEITLTVTKLKTSDGRLMIVPNKKFREDIVAIKVAGHPK
ncbi:MAG: mechanosensitive ion channel [Candidatus Hodarchaeaceae archaeon]|nr:mechanosensitive ion channel [Candidatus Hodarchaeaceae archaeon]